VAGLVSQAARSEVNADPDAILFIDEDIHVMIAAANGAELLTRHFLERREHPEFPGVGVE